MPEPESTPLPSAAQGLLADKHVLDSLDSSDANKSTVYLLRKKGLTSLPGTIFNFVCVCVGAGILGLPTSLAKVGWIGIFLMALVAVISNSTAKMLIACIHTPGEKLRCYEDIGHACFGDAGRAVVGVFQNVTLLGVGTIFLILIGGNMSHLLPNVGFGGHVWVLIFGCCLTPVTWLKTMREIQVLALFGALASATVATTVFFKGFIDGASSGAHDHSFFIGSGLPTGFNIIVFSFGFHAVLPHIEMMMEKREDFPKVSNISCSIIFSIYCLSASAAYFCYGANSGGKNGNVLDNMGTSNIVDIARVLITAHVFLAYPLPMNPVCIAVESVTKISRMEGTKELTYRIIARTVLVFITMFIASVVPFFGDFLSLISSVSTTFTAFIFPPVFYYILQTRVGNEISLPYRVYMLLIVIMGASAFTVGTYYSVDSLVGDFSSGQNPFNDFWRN